MSFRSIRSVINTVCKPLNLDFIVIDTDNYGDCMSCVNSELSIEFGANARGVCLVRWKKGMNGTVRPLTEEKQLFFHHYNLSEKEGNYLLRALSKYYDIGNEVFTQEKAIHLLRR